MSTRDTGREPAGNRPGTEMRTGADRVHPPVGAAPPSLLSDGRASFAFACRWQGGRLLPSYQGLLVNLATHRVAPSPSPLQTPVSPLRFSLFATLLATLLFNAVGLNSRHACSLMRAGLLGLDGTPTSDPTESHSQESTGDRDLHRTINLAPEPMTPIALPSFGIDPAAARYIPER